MRELITTASGFAFVALAVSLAVRAPSVPLMLLALVGGYVGAVWGRHAIWRMLVRAGFRDSRSAPTIEELEIQGLVRDESFQARAAFLGHAGDDLELAFLVELTDGRSLYLTGAYLEPYCEDLESDPEYESEFGPSAPSTFPCREFVVRRHAREGHALEIVCRGPLVPITRLPGLDSAMPDGTILSRREADDLVREAERQAVDWRRDLTDDASGSLP